MSNVTITFRPLTQWPAGRPRTPESDRVPAQFKRPGYFENSGTPNQRYVGRKAMPLSQTLRELDRELSLIGAADAVIQVDFPEQSLRRDGSGPRDDRRPNSPAVVLTFKRNGSVLTFPCDRFTRWQDNLRGIVLGLDGLRRLERYGIVQSSEQYRGWQALPASTTPALSTQAAANVLASRWTTTPDRVLADVTVARAAYRAARQRAHPDIGGSADEFNLIQEAARVLGAHHGVTL